MKTTDNSTGVNATADSSVGRRVGAKPPGRSALTARRRAVGWSQQNLAFHIGVHRNTVSRWERGRSVPDPDVRDLLAQALRLSVFELDEMLNGRRQPPLANASVPDLLTALMQEVFPIEHVLDRPLPYLQSDAIPGDG